MGYMRGGDDKRFGFVFVFVFFGNRNIALEGRNGGFFHGMGRGSVFFLKKKKK